MNVTIYRKVVDERPNHHLYQLRPGANYECRFTLQLENGMTKRMCISMKTKDLSIARKRRDGLLADLSSTEVLGRFAMKTGKEEAMK